MDDRTAATQIRTEKCGSSLFIVRRSQVGPLLRHHVLDSYRFPVLVVRTPGSSAKHTRKVHPSNGIIDAYLESGLDEVFDGPMEAGTEEGLRIRVKSDKNVTEDTRVI